MSEQTALTVRPLTPSVWNMITSIAPVIYRSRLFGVGSAEQAAAIMLKGHELGLGLTASFEFIHMVQGKPSLSPKGGLALIQRCGELEAIEINDAPNSCTVRMKRTNGFDYTLTFTLDDAKRAGLVKSGSAWESYGPNMLRWRAIGFCADVVFPDILGGLKRADELGAAIDAAGDVIEGEWANVSYDTTLSPAESPLDVRSAKVVTLDDLVNQYGADAVMAAAGGQIPSTSDEVAAVAAMLTAEAVPA